MAHQELIIKLEAATAYLRHASGRHRSETTLLKNQENAHRARFRQFNRPRLWEEQMEAQAGPKAFRK